MQKEFIIFSDGHGAMTNFQWLHRPVLAILIAAALSHKGNYLVSEQSLALCFRIISTNYQR
jgi:hypothetical protein